jgi:hypothetical protein
MTAHTKDRSTNYIGRYFVHDSLSGSDTINSRNQRIVRTRTGSGVPDWKRKIASHENATSSLTGVYESVEVVGQIDDRLTYYYDPVNSWGGQFQDQSINGNVALYEITPNVVTDTSLDNNVDGRASNKYLSAARELVTKMDGGTFLGELKQTLRMLRHPAEALSRSIDGYYDALSKRKREEVRRRRRKGLPPLPKDSPKWEWYHAIPDLWLEHSFGWKPLMMDIEDAWDALASLSEQGGVVHLSRAAQGSKLRSQSFFSGSLYAGTGIDRLRRDITNRQTVQTTIRYRGDVVAQAATTFADKAARWGFTPSQFVPTAWELLPWSFLVDYFASIGDFLDASFTNTASLKWTCKTIRRKLVTEKLISPNGKSTLATLPAAARASHSSIGPCYCKYTRVEVSRSAGGSPIPSVVFADFQDQSSRHIANMAALFGSFCNNLHSQNPSPRNFRR